MAKPNRPAFSTRMDEKIAGKLRGAAKALDKNIYEILEPALAKYLKDLEAEAGRRFKVAPPRPLKKAA